MQGDDEHGRRHLVGWPGNGKLCLKGSPWATCILVTASKKSSLITLAAASSLPATLSCFIFA